MTRAAADHLRRVLRLAWPIVAINVLNLAPLAVDMAICGRLPGSEVVLEGLGFALQITFLLMVAMLGLTVGTVALVSRAYGARLVDQVDHLVVQSFMLTVAVGVTVGVVGNLVAGPLVRLLGAPPEVADSALAFLRPLVGGAVFYYLLLLYAGVLRGVGNTRLPLAIAGVSNVVNIALDYCLILGHAGFPALGVRGAAIGTLCAYAFGTALYLVVLRRGAVPILRTPYGLRRIDLRLAVRLFRIGAPAALDMIIFNVAFLLFIFMLERFAGAAVAANQLGLRIQSLAIVPGQGVAQATGALVGQALGAGDAGEARRVTRASLVLCAAAMTALGLAIIALARPIIELGFHVPGDGALAGYALQWMYILGYSMPLFGLYMAFLGTLQGAGATNTTLAINAATTIGVQIPVGAVLGFGLGLGPLGIWLAFPIAFAAKVALCGVVYRRGRWARLGAGI